MTASFDAIPVGQGDAFILRRSAGTTILFDGGKNRQSLSSQLQSIALRKDIDIVVCSHADADHCNGLIGLLNQSIYSIKEVWLPGRWTDRLEDLMKNSFDFYDELAKNIVDSDCSIFESVHDDHTEGNSREPEGEVPLSKITDAFESDDDVSPWSDVFCTYGPLIWHHHPHASRFRVLVAAIRTAERIRQLAKAAHNHGARIRWFDFEEYQRLGSPSGGESFLQPMNAVELTASVRRRLNALRYLQLTVDNRESLVFLAPETSLDSAALFTADSDLAFSLSVGNPKRRVLVTAPHHGSDDNASAYNVIAKLSPIGGTLWVRSDGNYKKRPGTDYLSQQIRACTLCRGGSYPKQLVHVTDSSSWQLGNGIHSCQCV